jgi:hypothetical protein
MRSVAELNAIIEKLTKDLNLLHSYVTALEKELVDVNGPNWDLQAFRKLVFFQF